MADILVRYDPDEVLQGAKKILKANGELPTDCPKESCLSLGRMNLTEGQTTIVLNANPPQLPTNEKFLLYEIHPICKGQCRIEGNPNRCFVVGQDSVTGRVTFAGSRWRTDRF